MWRVGWSDEACVHVMNGYIPEECFGDCSHFLGSMTGCLRGRSSELHKGVGTLQLGLLGKWPMGPS